MGIALSKSGIFLYCLASSVIGFGVASWLPPDIFELKLPILALAAGSLCLGIVSNRRRTIKTAGWVCAAFFISIWRYGLSLPQDTPDKIWFYRGQEIEFSGMVDEEPEARERNQRLVVEARSVGQNAVSGRAIVYTPLYPMFEYGQVLKITGRVEAIKPMDEFAYDRYLARYGIYAASYYPKVELMAGGQGCSFYRALFRAKKTIRRAIERGLDEPSAGLARAFFLGDRGTIGRDLTNEFSRSGLAHIVAISGMHIAIAAAMISGVLYFLGASRRQIFYFISVFLALYTLLVGAPASAVRSAIMAWLVLLAYHLGRMNRAGRALALAAAVMLAFNPKLLRDDIGFELSFLAIWGMLAFYPRFNGLSAAYFPRLDAYPAWRWTWAAVSLTMSAQVLTWPVVAHGFSVLSLAAPLANLVVVWVSSPLLALLFGGVALSVLFPGGAVFWFAPARFVLWYLIKTAEISSSLPGAYWTVKFPFKALVLYYVTILFFYAISNRITNNQYPITKK